MRARAAGLAGAIGLALGSGLLACGGDDPTSVGDRDSEGAGTGDAASADRQAEVAERGAEVMPFDLDATTHRFTPTDDGLVETVVADDPTDDEQIALVQEHLAHEAERFRQGDFGDPATIHGHEMPGLATLEASAGELDVEISRRDDGARLTFTSDDPEVVEALHLWGEAQVSDHGSHAEEG